jgi:NDP-sugar pyrophosphorylase family protein
MITVEKKFAHKIEKYLKSQFTSQDPLANIDLVVFSEEEEPVKILQLLQSRIHSDFIVIEGNSLLDVPLDEILDTHLLTDASVTALIKEFDMVKGGEGAKLAEVGSEDVFGLTSYTPEQMRLGIQDQT